MVGGHPLIFNVVFRVLVSMAKLVTARGDVRKLVRYAPETAYMPHDFLPPQAEAARQAVIEGPRRRGHHFSGAY